MRKWFYVVVAAIVVGATPVFTSCIDNSEPEGLLELRQAKAELVRAKVAVEAAKAAKLQADAALVQAQAQVEAARVAYVQAQAAYEQARALEQQYLAEYQKLLNDAQGIENDKAKAELEELIAQYADARAKAEQEAQKAAAQLELDLLKVKTELAKQQAAYEEALKNLELAKVALTDEQKAFIQPLINEITAAKAKVERLAEDYEKAAQVLASAMKSLDKANAKESTKRKLEKAVIIANRNLSYAQQAEEVAKAEVDNFDPTVVSVNKWEEQYKAYEAKAEELSDNLEALNIEREQIVEANGALAEERNKILSDLQEIAGVWFVNADGDTLFFNQDGYAYRAEKPYTVKSTGFAIDDSSLPYQYQYNVAEFTYNYAQYLRWQMNGTQYDYQFSDGTYYYPEYGFIQLVSLNNLKSEIESWTLNDNDKAWTKDQLNYLKVNKENAQKAYTALLTKWKKAVEVYTTDNTDIDPTKMAGYEDLEKALNAYNAAVKAYNAAVADEKAKGEAKDKADKAVSDNIPKQAEAIAKANDDRAKAETAAATAQTTAYANAVKAYNTAVKGNFPDMATATADAAAQVATATTAYNTAKANYDAIVAGGGKAGEAPYDSALDTYTKASTALTAASTNQSTLSTAKTAADTAYTTAMTAAKDAETAAIAAANAAHKALTDAAADAAKAYTAAQAETPKAKKAVEDAFAAVQEPFDKFNEEWGIHSLSALYTAYNSNPIKEVKIDDVTLTTKTNLRRVIIDYSNTLYGAYLYSDGYKEGYINSEMDVARLVEMKKEDIMAYIEERFYSSNPDYTYVPTYVIENYLRNSFGLFGQSIYADNRYSIVESWLTNDSVIKAAIATVDAAIKEITDQLDANTAEVKAAQKAYTEKVAAYDALFTAIDEKIEQANREQNALKPVYDALAIAYLNAASAGDVDAADLDKVVAELKKTLQKAYEAAQDATFDAQTALMIAEENLKAWNSCKYDAVAVAQEALAAIDAKLKAAQEELAVLTEALQKAIAALTGTDTTPAE
ncbi:MAG: hypothetical protein LBL97_03860 [Prevotellaceae bacterium]|jgi:hypothetical protein|nr:hypothetical protein [Prevotellaceae bacterium]